MIYGYMLESTIKEATNTLENNIKEKSIELEDKIIIINGLKDILPALVILILDLILNAQKRKGIVNSTKITKKDIAEHIIISNIRELKPFINKKTNDIYYAFKLTIKLDNILKKKSGITTIPIQTLVFKNDKYYDIGTNIKYKE